MRETGCLRDDTEAPVDEARERRPGKDALLQD
jgi:hypothetical protein